jgi:hypothetical protein
MRQPTVALLGTAGDEFVVEAAGALRNAGARLTVLIRRGREEHFLREGLSVRTFPGRIAWYNLPVLAALRGVGATDIAVVVGDHFAHANVTSALNWWRAAGLLRGADIYVSPSTRPAELECFNTIDQRQWLAAGAAALVMVALALMYPGATLLAAAVAAGLELAARRARPRHSDERSACRAAWPILVDDPRLGWRLRSANITAWVAATDAPPRTIRVTLDADGHRRTGAAVRQRENRPTIAFYGGSYVFGDSLSDEETIPWHVATLMERYQVHNRGVPGYSALQAVTRLLDDVADHAPAAAVVIVDGSGPTELAGAGHARFPLSDHVAAWLLIQGLWNRRRERRGRERALLAMAERCARECIPLVVAVAGADCTDLGPVLSRCGLHWTTIDISASPASIAGRLAQDVRAAAEPAPRR